MFVWVLATIWVGILLQRNPSGHSRLSFLCSCVPESKEFQRKLDSHVHEGSFRELEQGKAQQANLNNTQWYWLDVWDVLKKVLCFPISVMVTGGKKKICMLFPVCCFSSEGRRENLNWHVPSVPGDYLLQMRSSQRRPRRTRTQRASRHRLNLANKTTIHSDAQRLTQGHGGIENYGGT